MPRLRPEQLAAALSRGLAPIYLISGDEPLLVQEACDQVRKAARDRQFTERELYHADAGFDWNQILSSANSLSLFADKKIIELRITSGKPGDKGSKMLADYASAPADDTLLLVVMPKADAAAQKSKWLKAIEERGIHVQIWPITPAQLPRWIGNRLQQSGLQADSSAIDLLASRVEGNLLAAAQEIEKLALLTRDKTISYELMASAVADSARYDIFGLTDKALQGDARAAVKTLQGLRTEGTEPITILWALTRDIRALNQIAAATAQGKSFDSAAKSAGIRDKRIPLVRAALQRMRPAQPGLLLRKANAIDKAIKGMRAAEPWDELLDLLLNIAGVNSLHPLNDRLALKLQ